MASINQNAYTSALPNFRNLGILLRVLVIVNALAIGAAVVRTPTLIAALDDLLEISALVQPLLIVSLLVLVALNGFLRRLPYHLGLVSVTAITVGLTVIVVVVIGTYYRDTMSSLGHYVVLALLTTGTVLVYF